MNTKTGRLVSGVNLKEESKKKKYKLPELDYIVWTIT